ncbi:uncharacterized protein LOC117180742 [Belonocnema kinseyi]|uniref:uncharacterized protein LOC117180742 n=1 Tax=Belonocnema kinseyi TaxID=2817044 RepID=UPI00143CC672|nr:uncharacterized protein LOC117180742 [Belonocnema kinseyi]
MVLRGLKDKKSGLHLCLVLQKHSGQRRTSSYYQRSICSHNSYHPRLSPSLSSWECPLTLGTLRQSYWILRGRDLIRSLIHRCIRNRGNTQQQLISDLCSIRITPPERAFINTGVAYAAPINVRTSEGRSHHSHKAWICIFVCCASRSVHLELVSDYTAEAFIAAYIRFISRRGLCRTLSTDEGANFVEADRQLQEMFSEASAEFASIATYLASLGTQWKFNPPAAPNFGSLWEAAVKSTKFHLCRVIGDSTLTFEEIITLLTQIEACLNSRPLRAQSDDPTDISALTSGHFLIGGLLNTVSEPSLADILPNRLNRWQLIQQMRDHFWERWSDQYLKELQPRSK